MNGQHAAMWMLELAGRAPGVVLGAARDLIAGARHRIHVVERDGEEKLLYVLAECSLDEALRGLETGALRSIRFDVEGGGLDWLLLYAPRFAGEASSWWSLIAQQSSGDPLRLFRTAIQRSGLYFAALTADESMDDLPVNIDADNFPWRHPDLVVGAVYDDMGGVTARLGPYLIPPPV
jgi:hypothetical protein